MKVQFKDQPQMCYDVLDENETQYKISIMGWINKEELTEYDESLDLPHIVDVAIFLTLNPEK